MFSSKRYLISSTKTCRKTSSSLWYRGSKGNAGSIRITIHCFRGPGMIWCWRGLIIIRRTHYNATSAPQSTNLLHSRIASKLNCSKRANWHLLTRSTLLMRWEWRESSAMLVHWKQRRLFHYPWSTAESICRTLPQRVTFNNWMKSFLQWIKGRIP